FPARRTHNNIPPHSFPTRRSSDLILLQLPLPNNMDSTPALEAMDPGKDADGLHPYNLGQLFEYKSWNEMASGKSPLSCTPHGVIDRKSTRLNSSHDQISYAVFCLK